MGTVMGQLMGRVRLTFAAVCAIFGAFALSVGAFGTAAVAQDAAPVSGPSDTLVAPEGAAPAEMPAPLNEAPEASGAYVPMAPEAGKGMPTSFEDGALKSMTFQDQYTQDGAYALGMHDYVLLPVITVISLFVLGLLLYVVARYNRKANPVPSKTTHNTAIEVIWTIIPVIILVVIAVPSITLLARQYDTPPADAVTIKATGYQWYWGYNYPDHGDFEIVSNMLSDGDALANGEPAKLAVDNRMVVPAGVPLRIQTTGADVIHSFAVPSLWFKQDAVPGRLNEKLLTIEEPGVYYGQCSELCGSRHAYMPIAVEALPMEEFEAWVREQGGTVPGDDAAGDDAAGEAADEVAEVALAE